jgi:hypothetical protein
MVAGSVPMTLLLHILAALLTLGALTLMLATAQLGGLAVKAAGLRCGVLLGGLGDAMGGVFSKG